MKNKLPEAIKKIFSLSAAEERALLALNVSDDERALFELFRQSFAFSSGEVPVQIELLVAFTNYLSEAQASILAKIIIPTEVSDAVVTFNRGIEDTAIAEQLIAYFEQGEDLPDYLKNFPLYFLYIQAPRKHEVAGKKTDNRQQEIIRVNGILQPLVSWLQQLKQIQDYDKNFFLISSFTSFVARDADFTRKSEDESVFTGEKKRKTGVSLHASFLREFILNSAYDNLFAPPIAKIINEWRSIFIRYKQFIQLSVLSENEDTVYDLQQWLHDLENSEKDVDDSYRPKLAEVFEEKYHCLPTLDEASLICSLYSVISGWQQHYPEELFFIE